MKNLINLIFRFHFFILFILFEALSFFLLVQNNSYQRSKVLNSTNIVSGIIYSRASSIIDYLNLKNINYELANQNEITLNKLKSSYKSNQIKISEILDSTYQQQYVFIVSKIINNSVNRQNNYITLNKGEKHGIMPEMAVVGPKGIVGIVKNVSSNFSSVISVLNSNLWISGKIKTNNYYGSIHWNGNNYTQVILDDIPNHVKINIGDTIITTSYSAIFPEGEIIGYVSDFEEKKGTNFHKITVNLATDFKNLSYVYVIGNLLKKEQIYLEKTTEND